MPIAPPAARALTQGAALGLAFASVCAIGLVAIVYNTLPEMMFRPLADFALPLIARGCVTSHVAEWVGITGPAPWYLFAAGLFAIPMLLLTAPTGRAARVGAFLLSFALAIAPQFTPISANARSKARRFADNFECGAVSRAAPVRPEPASR